MLRVRYREMRAADDAQGIRRVSAILFVTDGAWTNEGEGAWHRLDAEDVVPDGNVSATPAFIKRMVDAQLASVLTSGGCGLYSISSEELARHNYFETLSYNRGVAAHVADTNATTDAVRAFNATFGDILDARCKFEITLTAQATNKDASSAFVSNDKSTSRAAFGLLTPATHGGRIVVVPVPATAEVDDELCVVATGPPMEALAKPLESKCDVVETGRFSYGHPVYRKVERALAKNTPKPDGPRFAQKRRCDRFEDYFPKKQAL
jgi:hypothetical protein